jgi:hypothetical protein
MVAAKEGLTIYMRGRPVYFDLPDDLPERMLDYVLHVFGTLALLVMPPGSTPASARNVLSCRACMDFCLGDANGRKTLVLLHPISRLTNFHTGPILSKADARCSLDSHLPLADIEFSCMLCTMVPPCVYRRPISSSRQGCCDQFYCGWVRHQCWVCRSSVFGAMLGFICSEFRLCICRICHHMMHCQGEQSSMVFLRRCPLSRTCKHDSSVHSVREVLILSKVLHHCL